MAFDRREIVVAIIRWLTASGVEQSLGEFVAQLENDFVGEGQQMNLRQLRLLVEYTSFELTDHKIVQSNKAGVNPRRAIDPSTREIILQIILSRDWSPNSDHKNSASKMRQSLEEPSEFPTRLKSFLETNELNIADLFQLSLAELEKVPNFGPDTLNFISFFYEEKR